MATYIIPRRVTSLLGSGNLEQIDLALSLLDNYYDDIEGKSGFLRRFCLEETLNALTIFQDEDHTIQWYQESGTIKAFYSSNLGWSYGTVTAPSGIAGTSITTYSTSYPVTNVSLGGGTI